MHFLYKICQDYTIMEQRTKKTVNVRLKQGPEAIQKLYHVIDCGYHVIDCVSNLRKIPLSGMKSVSETELTFVWKHFIRKPFITAQSFL